MFERRCCRPASTLATAAATDSSTSDDELGGAGFDATRFAAAGLSVGAGPGSTDPSQEAVKRTNIDVKVSAYDLAHTFFPAWEQTIKEGKALGAENTAQLCVFTVPYACPEPVLADHRFHTKTQLRICALHIVQA